MRGRRFSTIAISCAIIGATLLGALSPGGPFVATAVAAPAMTGLHVAGNQIVNGNGEVVRLRGVNRSGMEFACIQGWGIFDGPSDDASVAAIAAWGVNAVRIPVNAQCWLGVNGVKPEYGGANYQRALSDYIGLINAGGMAAIIDLHWTAPGAAPANAQTPMPDLHHAPTFWAQVANSYKGNGAVLFDLFNEPYPDNNRDTAEAWRCWRDGGTCGGVGYQAAGMQTLVNAVRGTGATNIILLGGVAYAAHLSRWLTFRPVDPTGNLAAAWHIYDFSQCNTPACWDAEAAPVAAQVPLVAGEIGQCNCAHDFIDALMDWHDARGASYLGWTWNTWDCGSGPALISNYDGTPTAFGAGLKNRLAGAGSPPSPSPAPLPSPPSGPASSFADVPAGYWATDQIAAVARRGITTGCGVDDAGRPLYCPERGVTRAEMAVFLTRTLGQDQQAPPSGPTFADVPTGYWAYRQVEVFLALGITTGCGEDPQGRPLFCPERGVTRAEMAAFMVRARQQMPLTPATPTFADVATDYWAFGQIERFLSLGVTTGCGTDDHGRRRYCPDRGVTRAEMAVFIIRAFP